jgi:hypothetical protein
MLSEVAQLREIARRARAGQPLGDDLGIWLADSLQKFLEHRCGSMDDALGLRAARGGVPWWLEEAIRRRNEALQGLAREHYPGMTPARQAKLIRAASVRFVAVWPRERDLPAPPARYARTPREWLWRAFKSGAPMPLGERQLRTLLGH